MSSREIDERVVEMRFDNQQFERNVQTSMSTLDKLKEKLNFSGAVKGLEKLGTTASNFSMSGLNTAVETVHAKFSAFEVMAVTALANITNSAVNAGKNLVKSLSVEQISEGWGKYAEKTASVQTIMNATGKSIDEVNGYLDRLMWFSDETSYGFTDMTAALAQMTSSGGDIDKLIPLITGVANATAFAGKGAAEFSRVMYNLNQSYSKGYLDLMDWKSIDGAGASSKQLREILIGTAVELGKINEGDVTLNNFTETLKDKWADTEVLEASFGKFSAFSEKVRELVDNGEYKSTNAAIAALSKNFEKASKEAEKLVEAGEFSSVTEALKSMGIEYDAIAIRAFTAGQEAKSFSEVIEATQDAVSSGWMKTFELIFGNYEEAKVLWTDLANAMWDAFASGAESRNAILEEWKKDNGRDDLIEGFWNVWYAASDVISNIKSGFRDIFPETTSEQLLQITKRLKDTTARFGDLHKILSIMDEEEVSFTEAFNQAYDEGDLTTSFDALWKLKDIYEKITNAARGFAAALSTGFDIIKDVAGMAKDALSDSFKGFGKGALNIISDFGNRLAKVKTTFSDFHAVISRMNETGDGFSKSLKFLQNKGDVSSSTDALQKLYDAYLNVKKVIGGFVAALDIGWQFIKAVAGGIKSLLGNFTGLGSGILGAAGSLGEWVSNLRDSIKENKTFEKAVGKVVSVLQWIIDKVKAVSPHLSTFWNWIKKIASSFAGWVSGIKKAAEETGIFGEIVQRISGFLKSAKERVHDFFSAINEKVSGSTTFSGLLGVLESIWNVLKFIGSKAVSVLKTIGSKISEVFRNGDLKMGLDTLNSGIFAAILLKVKDFVGTIKDFGSAGKGFLENITGILDGVKGCLESWQQNIKADTLLKLAGAIAILAGSLFVIATIDSDKLTTSLGAVAALFGELVGAMVLLQKFTKNGDDTSSGLASFFNSFKKDNTSKNMIAMAGAVLILSFALKNLAGLSSEQLGVGLTGITVLLGELVAAMKILQSDTKKSIKGATQIVILAAAVKILANVCKDLSSLSWEELAKGLAGVGGLLLELIAFMKLIGSSKLSFSTALSIVVVSAALKILASVCKDFGDMDWGSIGKGLASVGALLLELALFTKLVGNTKNMLSIGIGMIAISAALKIMVGVMQDLSQLSWEEIAKGLVAVAGALISISISMRILPKGMISKSIGLVVVAAALTILAKALQSMGGMSWSEIAKGLVALGGSMLILALGLNAMSGAVAGSAALLISTVALMALSKVLKTLGGMSLAEIGKGLLAIAGVITILGVAGALLAPVVPTILGLGGAMLLFGAGCALVGAGVLALSVGLTGLSASLVVVAESIVQIIVSVVSGIGEIIVAVCTTISNSATSIAEALVAVVTAACYALKETAPQIAETALSLLVEGLTLLKNYIPQIVNLLVDVIGSLLDSLSLRVPELVDKVLNFIGVFMSSLNAALGDDGLKSLISSLESVALVFVALGITAKVVSTIPIQGALVGIAGLAIVVAGIAAILAALGGLAQIPGFTWIIDEGTKVLGQIGTAIGTFVGNIVGGVIEGVSNSLPVLGQNLSDFMTNVTPFIEGIRSVDGSVLAGAAYLAGALLAITAADVVAGLTSWITGGSSLTSFGEDLAAFGPKFKEYADAVSGIDGESVMASATAAQALSALASGLPNEGGLVSLFTGDNNIASFGKDLVKFGEYMKQYSDAIAGMNPIAVTMSAIAGTALAEMANHVPNSGGLAAWFAGDNSIASFGEEMVSFGSSLKDYGDSVAGVNADDIVESARAGRALADLANTIPNSGGVAAWFAGDNSIASFGTELISFGQSIAEYAKAVVGIKTDDIYASVDAGKAIASLADVIPNEGGVVAWFTGDNSLGKFSEEVISFGDALKGFATSVSGIKSEGIIEAADAGKALAKMADTVPNEGGMVAWFTGDNSIAKFGDELEAFGKGINAFSKQVTDVNTEKVDAAVVAGEAIAKLAEKVPNEGGVVGWFAGENSVSKFGEDIEAFGKSLAAFSKNVEGVSNENVDAAVAAGVALAGMADTIPNEGGVVGWFAGENSVSKFGEDIASFGENLKTFSDNVDGISPENVSAAAAAGKELAAMADTVPNSGGVAAWFAGDNSLGKFGSEIAEFGKGIKNFCTNIGTEINPEIVSAACEAGEMFARLTNTIPNSGGVVSWFAGDNSLASFGGEIAGFGTHIKQFVTNLGTKIDTDIVQSAVDAGTLLAQLAAIDVSTLSSVLDSFESLCTMSDFMAETDYSGFNSFSEAMSKLATDTIEDFISTFEGAYPKVVTTGETFIQKLITGVNNKKNDTKTTLSTLVSDMVSTIRNKYTEFYNAGMYFVEGFAAGITKNTYKATAQSKAMAEAAANAARKALDEHSPSKVGGEIGEFFDLGVAGGIRRKITEVYGTAYSMGEHIKTGLSNALSKISDLVSSGLDMTPVITPVVDLSNVESSSGLIGSMLRVNPSVAAVTSAGVINARMNAFQNGSSNDDVISAINELGNKLGQTTGDTYNINGVTYDDGSNVSDAVQELFRAARIERRR